MKKPCSNCVNAQKINRLKSAVYFPYSIVCLNCDKYKKYLRFRESKRMYEAGKPISSMKEFEEHIHDGFMFYNHKLQHIGWLISMQYRVLQNAVCNGHIYVAIKKENQNE